jgi:hypothetical protein
MEMLRKCIIVLALGLLLAVPASARNYKGDDTMLVSPYLFVLDYQGASLTIHTEVPYSQVDRTTIELHCDGTIAAVFTKSDQRGNLVVKFAADDVRTIVSPPRAELTMTGLYRDGGSFTLTASIRVK